MDAGLVKGEGFAVDASIIKADASRQRSDFQWNEEVHEYRCPTVTTPNYDVIYAMGYLDLKQDGPMVIEVPPGMQGILDDFFQRPICSEGQIEGRQWCGDVGLPGPDKGPKYPATFVDAKGEFLSGSNAYTLNLPKGIPAALFWSVTVYDSITASGVDNGQPFPSLNAMDKPLVNADGSIDVHFGPQAPGDGKNWIRTLPGKGFFVILRLYGPTKAFFDKEWKPGDLQKR
jgi:hypothetical protein